MNTIISIPTKTNYGVAVINILPCSSSLAVIKK
jgi:hypothetical protein